MQSIIDKLIPHLHKFNFFKKVIGLWLTFFLITGVLIFMKPKNISPDYVNNSSISNFYSPDTGPDRGILIDDPIDSGLARLKIIQNAKTSLNISYFAIEAGESPNLFFGALLDAADRGVKVNLLLDGISHGLRKDLRPILYTFMLHPNMNLKFYEPFNPFMPWTINNRMHDKYIIADNSIAIIGGRNIGDKYFAPTWYDKKVTNDRDVIIFTTNPKDLSSVIHKMSGYFNFIWSHKYSKVINKKLFLIREKKAIKKSNELKEKFSLFKETNKDILQEPIDLMKISFSTNKISFIHNPIERFSKDPWLWYELTELMKSAKKSIFIQSPYVIPSKSMTKGYLNKENFNNIEVSILTNSLASTPNLPAYAGYLNHRKRLVNNNINIYEFQSIDSLHTKAFVIDNDLLAIGSFNLDHRSSFLSTESMVVIHSSEAVKKLEEGLMDYIDKSLLVDKNYNYKPNSNIIELPVNPVKKFIITLASHIVKLFEYLL